MKTSEITFAIFARKTLPNGGAASVYRRCGVTEGGAPAELSRLAAAGYEAEARRELADGTLGEGYFEYVDGLRRRSSALACAFATACAAALFAAFVIAALLRLFGKS